MLRKIRKAQKHLDKALSTLLDIKSFDEELKDIFFAIMKSRSGLVAKENEVIDLLEKGEK